MLAYSLIRSPIGWIGVVGHSKGIVALLRGIKNRSALHRKLRRRYPDAVLKKEVLLHQTRTFLDYYFKGKSVPPPPVDLASQTPFQRKVLRQVCQIPYGHVRTYTWLAKKVQRPSATRACGQVLSRNPLPLLIPCHRIMLKSGKHGDFTWGRRMKKKLLHLEKVE